MKILTKEEESAHYRATLKGGTLGGLGGLAFGALGVYAASRRYHFFRQLTLPLKAFLVTSSGTFSGIIAADHASRAYESSRNPKEMEYREMEREKYEAVHRGMTWTQRGMEFGKKERYKIVGASWVASMFAAFALVNRNKYLTGPQKLVQARVYAQFLTLGVLVASAAFEISDSKNEEGKLWETVKYPDPADPSGHRMLERKQEVERSDGDTLWKDMVAAEEERLKERDENEKKLHKEHDKKQPPKKQEKKDNDAEKHDSKGDKKDPNDNKKDSKDEKKGKK